MVDSGTRYEDSELQKPQNDRNKIASYLAMTGTWNMDPRIREDDTISPPPNYYLLSTNYLSNSRPEFGI